MTQIYQVAEDSRRGDRTLVIKVGVGIAEIAMMASAAGRMRSLRSRTIA